MPDLPQLSVSGYRITARVAQGGAGMIYKAMRAPNKPARAIKILHPHLMGNASAVSAFRNEYDIAADLRHPGILRYHACGMHEGAPYILMDFFPSITMNVMIHDAKTHRLHERIHPLLIKSAEALAFLHENAILHRDIKPGNILLGEDDTIRVIDFSIATPLRGKGSLVGRLMKNIRKGKVAGTPSYMAPEQIRGEDLTPATDVYAFGVTLFEMATRRVPFIGSSQQEVLNAAVHEPPPTLRSLNPAVSKPFDKLVMRMLAKKPADRVPNLEAFLGEFQSMPIFEHA